MHHRGSAIVPYACLTYGMPYVLYTMMHVYEWQLTSASNDPKKIIGVGSLFGGT